jgi:hypothetical protein
LIQTIYGPLDEPLQLCLASDTVLGSGGGELLSPDPSVLEQHVRCLLEDPYNREQLRRVLEDDSLAIPWPSDDQDICDVVVALLSRGTLVLVRQSDGTYGIDAPEAQQDTTSQAPHERQSALTPLTPLPPPAPRPPEPLPPPKKTEEKVRDWKVECKHHAIGSRDFLERAAKIQVVPDKGETTDEVTVHWRDDYLGSMPPSLALMRPGAELLQAKRSGQGGGYTAYKGEVTYHGDWDEIRFPLPIFWSALNDKTIYAFDPGPRTIRVEVYNPRQFKIELKFPALRSFKAGSKFSKSSWAIEGDKLKDLSLVKKKTVTVEREISMTGWKPSSRVLSSGKTTSTLTISDKVVTPNVEAQGWTARMPLDTIVLTRDGKALQLEIIKLVGSILEFLKDGLDIIKTIQDYAPKVGWYTELDIQVMQGGLAAEWYWKEWQDHRVFRYIDVKASLEIIRITFEVGVGVSAFAFKAQIFAQCSGALGVELSGTRYEPDGEPGFTIQRKERFTGALGARVEAGNALKIEAKGESALEFDCTIGINHENRSQLISFDGGVTWTGIECTATGSMGLLGIGGSKTWSGTLVEKSRRIPFEWPGPKEYKPPFMSRDAIKSELRKVLSEYLDVRVFAPSGSMFTFDKQWSLDEIAGALADRIERDKAFHRTPAMVDALANAIRQDLDALADRWGRDWIEADRFKQYINGSIEGRSLAKHLKDGASPLYDLTGAPSP